MQLHPHMEEARRLLNIAPTIESLHIEDEAVRIVAARHAMRRLAEEATERLIDLLDDLDGDPDLEPSTAVLAHEYGLPSGCIDECEDVGDDEPYLGTTEMEQRSALNLARDDDREEEHDGREPDVDREATNGWTIDCSLGKTGHTDMGDNCDREPNGDEEDHSGYAEDDFLLHPGPVYAGSGLPIQVDESVAKALREIDVTGPDGNRYRVTPV